MNAGQRLVQLSGLPSGTALAHFAAITQTSGGAGQTVFAHRCDVSIVETSLSVLNKAKNAALDDLPRISKVDARKKAVHVFVGAADTVRVADTTDEVTVVQKNLATTVSQKLMTETIKKVRNG